MMERCVVLIFSENAEWAEGLVATGRSIADELGGTLGLIVMSGNDSVFDGKEVAKGVDIVYRWNSGDFQGRLFPEYLAAGISSICASLQPDVLLMASSPLGKEVVSRVAADLDSACVTEWLDVYVDKNDACLVAEKSLFGGVVIAEIVLRSKIKICACSLENLTRSEEYVSRYELIAVSPDTAKLPNVLKEVVEVRPVQKSVDLTGAKKIVSVGRGCKKQEDVAIIKDLCDVLQAELGCSRPVAEELRWLPEERKVGLTGVSVKPDLYVAAGISGQVQHLAGIKDARIVVVINNDKKAPFFNAADYGLIGDFYEIVPELINALR